MIWFVIIAIVVLAYSVIPTYLYKAYEKCRKKQNDKIIYLTFDDGPDPLYTPQLLSLLSQYNIKATFFCVAEAAKNNPQIISEMKQSGHSIALHSYSHQSAMLFTPRKTKKDLVDSVSVLKKLGIIPSAYRPPWGHTNILSFIYAKKLKLKTVLWSVMIGDWRADLSSEELCDRLLKKVHSGDIICLHDGRGENGAPGRTIEALATALPVLIKNGYQFAVI